MRKIAILGMLVIMLCGLAIPSFAVGGSGTDDTVYYPVFAFDTIEWDSAVSNENYSMPFPFNSGMNGMAEYSFFDDLVHGHQGLGEDPDSIFPRIVGSMTNTYLAGDIGEEVSFTMKSGSQVIYSPQIDGEFLIEINLDDIDMIRTEFNASYYTIEPDLTKSGYYGAELHTFNWTEYYYPDEIIDVSYSFRRLAEVASVDGYIFLNDCDYTVSFARKSVATPRFEFTIGTNGSTSPGRPSDFASWLYFSDIPVSSGGINAGEDISITSWLGDSVLGFLDLEIFPGFSISKIFSIVLVVGVLLWFIKLLT